MMMMMMMIIIIIIMFIAHRNTYDWSRDNKLPGRKLNETNVLDRRLNRVQ